MGYVCPLITCVNGVISVVTGLKHASNKDNKICTYHTVVLELESNLKTAQNDIETFI